MWPVSAGFLQALRSDNPIVYHRLLSLDPETHEPIAELTSTVDLPTGQVEQSSGRVRVSRLWTVRREIVLSLVRAEWPGDSSKLLFLRRLVSYERGLLVGGTPEYVPQGVFVINRPRGDWEIGSSRLQISGNSLSVLASRSKVGAPEVYEEGTLVSAVMAAILSGAGIDPAWVRDKSLRNPSLRVDHVVPTRQSRVDAVIELAGAHALDIYDTADGYIDIVDAPIELGDVGEVDFEYMADEQGIMTGVSKEMTDDIYANHVIVSGQNSRRDPVFYEVRDMNPLSPGYNPPPGHADYPGSWGDIVDDYVSPDITDVDQCRDVAMARLVRLGLIAEQVSITGIVNPAFTDGDTIRVVHGDSGTDNSYVLDSWDVPFSGTQTIDGRYMRPLT